MNAHECKQVWHVLVILLLLTVGLFFSKEGITGQLSKDIERAQIGIIIDQSARYVLNWPENKRVPLHMLSISGEVLGKGLVEVYLDNGFGAHHLVYSNEEGKNTQHGETAFSGENTAEISITKYQTIAAPAKSHRLPQAGVFRNVCEDTCVLNPEVFAQERYELVVFVEEGTRVRIDELRYT